MAKKGLKIGLGFLLLALGLILLGLPGPGLLVIAAGLAMLAQDYPWAQALLANAKRWLAAGWQWLKKAKANIKH